MRLARSLKGQNGRGRDAHSITLRLARASRGFLTFRSRKRYRRPRYPPLGVTTSPLEAAPPQCAPGHLHNGGAKRFAPRLRALMSGQRGPHQRRLDLDVISSRAVIHTDNCGGQTASWRWRSLSVLSGRRWISNASEGGNGQPHGGSADAPGPAPSVSVRRCRDVPGLLLSAATPPSPRVLPRRRLKTGSAPCAGHPARQSGRTGQVE